MLCSSQNFHPTYWFSLFFRTQSSQAKLGFDNKIKLQNLITKYDCSPQCRTQIVRFISPADRLSVVPPMPAKKTLPDAAFIGDSVITVGSVAAGARAAAVAWVAAVTATAEGATMANDEGASVAATAVDVGVPPTTKSPCVVATTADAIKGSVLMYCKLTRIRERFIELERVLEYIMWTYKYSP